MRVLNPMDLRGKNILVTGASSGIGNAIAVHISRLGANVIMAARNREKLEEVLKKLGPGKHTFHLIDLSNLDDIEGLIDNICKDGTKLSGLVHSAGISLTMPIQYLKMSDIKNIMAVNFFSFMELTRQFSKNKNHDKQSSIVAISSISSKVGARGLSAYCASKGALESAVKALALDLASKKIRINAIAPGMIRTQIYDSLKEIVNNNDFESELKKRQILGIGNPEDVANAAAYLLSDASSFITGTTMVVDGGYTAH